MTDHCFISYSDADALEFARKLANKLEGGTPGIPVWLDKDDLKPSREWDIQIDHALKTCRMVLFVMTKDSAHEKSVCRQEWSRALSFKKPIVPLWVHDDIDVPFRLQDRQRVDFRGEFERGLAQLRDYLVWFDSPEGVLQSYKDRLLDAERDLQRVREIDKPRIREEIDELKKQIETQQKVINNPRATQEQTQKNIDSGRLHDIQRKNFISEGPSEKIINSPPSIVPTYFQDRLVETEQIVNFLNDKSQRLMTIVGRGGIGKTTIVSRLLKAIENEQLPDGLGEMEVDGIVYLSEIGNRKINFTNIYTDLGKLLPDETASEFEIIFKNPYTTTEEKMRKLLGAFRDRQIILLLDNFESLIDIKIFNLNDGELSDALNAVLLSSQHGVKVIITTRIAPQALALVEPSKQLTITLDNGLKSPYAENVLREMDTDGNLGLKTAPEELLRKACEKTRGIPRALEVLYATLSVDRYTTLEELVEIKPVDSVVDKFIWEAFSRLDSTAQKVMQALAVYNRPVSSAAIDFLLQPQLPSIDSELVLELLVKMHLARREGGKYYLHPADIKCALDSIPKIEKVPYVNPEGIKFAPVDTDFVEFASDNLELNSDDPEIIKVDFDDLELNSDNSEHDISDIDRFETDPRETRRNLTEGVMDFSTSGFTQHSLKFRAKKYFSPRFANLSQEAAQYSWDKWKHVIWEILGEFNDSVFNGSGMLFENAEDERLYFLLDSKKQSLYIFPLPDNLLSLGVYRHKIPKERLASKFATDKPDDENLIGWLGLDAGALEGRYGEDKETLQYYLEKALRRLQRSYWTKTIA